MFKQRVKKIIGLENTRKIALLRQSFTIQLNRTLRAGKLMLKGGKDQFTKPVKFAVPGWQTFFGYYDVIPFSKDDNLLLAMAAPLVNQPPTQNDEIHVGYFDLNNKEFHPIDKTSTWCWQMGCRLQWFPEDENRLIIYNKIVDGAYGSVVQDIKSKKIVIEFKRPVYAIDRAGQWALSLNFSRLHRLRPGYGYLNFQDDTKGDLAPIDDGLWLMDLKTRTSNMLISLEKLARTDPVPTMEGAEHYVNHLAFNPSGTRFMFFHLWTKKDLRWNRLITMDRQGGELYVLENEGNTSHYTWKSDDELLTTVVYPDGVICYNFYKDKTRIKQVIGQESMHKDGHPSYAPGRETILTDTYPDKYGEQSLLLYRPTGEYVELSKFFSPISFRGEVRCDLHPRWNRTGTSACVDAPPDGCRALYVVKIQPEAIISN